MKGWTMPIQRASFGGVRFEVFSVEDSLERTVVEHAYPFVNGADLEDLGLNPLTVQMQAVFYGEGYYINFKKFLAAMQKQGVGVLTHPIRGRLQNMLCVSAQFRHEADFVNYVTVDLTFREATPAKPIFVFKFSILAKLDELLTQLEDFIDDCVAFFAEIMESISVMANFKDRLLSCYGALYGCFEQVLNLFDLDKSKYSLSPFVSTKNFKAQSVQAAGQLLEMIGIGLQAVANQPSLSVKSQFNEVLRTVNTLQAIPDNLVTGKDDRDISQQLAFLTKVNSATASHEGIDNSSATSTNNTSTSSSNNHLASMVANQMNGAKSLTGALTHEDVKYISSLIHLATTVNLVQIATTLLEDENLLPDEVDYITTKVRSEIQKTLLILRKLNDEEEQQTLATVSKPTTGVYAAIVKLSDKLRDQAHQLTQLALAVINRKPPLMIRTAEFDGHILQFAHAFYQDFSRAEELLRLNPQIRYANFISRGEVLNSYAK